MHSDAPLTDYAESDLNQYLDRVLEAGVFERDSRLHKLLVHILEREMAGDGANLKAYSIGLDVFDKTEDFDPSSDSSVRVAAGRLRTALKLFESSDFADTQLMVDLPVGTYRPTIAARPHEVSQQTEDMPPIPTDLPAKAKRRTGPLLVVGTIAAVLGYQQFIGGAAKRSVDLDIAAFKGDPALADAMSVALRQALSRSKAISVVPSNTTTRGVDFRLNGTATRLADNRTRLAVELTSESSNRIVWASSLDFDVDDRLQERVAQTMGSELRVRVFGASKEELRGRDPETLTAEQLFIMATWVPGPAINSVEWELERIRLMRIALEKDPNFGAAHSVMADKLAYLANVYGPSNTAAHSAGAITHARAAMEQSPLNADVMFNVAQAFWHSGMLAESEAVMRRVVELDPSHDLARFLAQMIPHTCAKPPEITVEWARAFDSRLSVDNPIRWLTLTWIAWLYANQDNYLEALNWEERAALIFEIPYTFMRHAMILNELGRPEDAVAILEDQRGNWPDIDPAHFADVTYPRLCSEVSEPGDFVTRYERLATAFTQSQ